jgi:hypothetical protein
VTNIDHDKLPTTPFAAVIVGGANLTSRYRKQDELALMARVVSALPDRERSVMEAMFCDSKAMWCFAVDVKPGFDHIAYTAPLRARINALLLRYHGGHNGLYIGKTWHADQDWAEDFVEMSPP